MYPRPKFRRERGACNKPDMAGGYRTIMCRRTSGFSLIELMIGMLISMICVLAIMAAFAVYEAQKRTTTSGNDAQQNGSFSLYDLGRQIRTAGSGLTQGYRYGLWGCSISAHASGAQIIPSSGALPSPFNNWPRTSSTAALKVLAMPVLIVAGGTDASGNALPDSIAVIGGNSAGTVFKSVVQSTPDAATIVLDNALGIAANDYLIGTTTAGDCVVGMTHTVTPASNQVSLAVANSPTNGFIGTTYVFDLGSAPTFSLYGVDTTTNTLVMYDLLRRSGNATLPVADGIVAIKALYGVDDGTTTASIPGSGVMNDGVVDAWVQPSGSWSAGTIMAASQATVVTQIQQVKAIRLVIVARSQLPEKVADYSGSNSLTLFRDLPANLQYRITTQPQYRYKVYDTTIPIRNTIINKWL